MWADGDLWLGEEGGRACARYLTLSKSGKDGAPSATAASEAGAPGDSFEEEGGVLSGGEGLELRLVAEHFKAADEGVKSVFTQLGLLDDGAWEVFVEGVLLVAELEVGGTGGGVRLFDRAGEKAGVHLKKQGAGWGFGEG